MRVHKFIFSYWIWKKWQNNIKIFSTDPNVIIPKESMNKEIRLKKIDETRNDLIEEMNYWVRSIKMFVEFWIILITHLL